MHKLTEIHTETEQIHIKIYYYGLFSVLIEITVQKTSGNGGVLWLYGNCRLCADTVLFRNGYFVRSCAPAERGLYPQSFLAADIFTVLMFLVLDCFIVQVFLFCRRLFRVFSLACCLLVLSFLLVCAAAELCSATQGAALHLQGAPPLDPIP